MHRSTWRLKRPRSWRRVSRQPGRGGRATMSLAPNPRGRWHRRPATRPRTVRTVAGDDRGNAVQPLEASLASGRLRPRPRRGRARGSRDRCRVALLGRRLDRPATAHRGGLGPPVRRGPPVLRLIDDELEVMRGELGQGPPDLCLNRQSEEPCGSRDEVRPETHARHQLFRNLRTPKLNRRPVWTRVRSEVEGTVDSPGRDEFGQEDAIATVEPDALAPCGAQRCRQRSIASSSLRHSR
jgi:hypothetical protein